MRTIVIVAIILFIVLGVVVGIYSYAYRNRGQTPQFDEGGTLITVEACLILGCPENTIYVGSRNSDKYYECECRWAKTVRPENIVCFSSDDAAIDDGREKSEC